MVARRSLRTKLILLFLAALAVNIAAAGWTYYRDRDSSQRAAVADLLNAARLIAARQEAVRSRAEAILDGLTASPELHPGRSGATCATLLTQRLRQQPQFVNLAMALPSGELVCAAVSSPRAVNVADRAYFRRALETDRTVASEVLLLRGLQIPSIAFAKSLRDQQGHALAVLILTLDLDWLARALARAQLPDGAHLTVVDSDGRIAARIPDDGTLVGTSITHTRRFWRLRSAAEGDFFEDVGLDGQLRLFAHDRMLDTVNGPLHLFLSVPKSAVFAPALREATINLSINAGVLLATLGLILWGTERFVMRPVNILVRTADGLSASDPNAHSGLPHDGTELGKLAQALDGAACAIAERERQLAASEQRFRRLNELSSDWIWERDEELRLTYVSPSYFAFSGEHPEDVIGRPVLAYLSAAEEDLIAPLQARRPFRDVESVRRRPDGTLFWRSVSGEPLFDQSGAFKGYRGTGRDITELKQHEEELRRQATTDALTGLPNRTLLRDRLEHALERSGRSQKAVAIVMLDLDDFKEINDAIGHPAGDAVLRLIASRLLNCVRPEDTVARVGGDEFIVVLEDVENEESVELVAERIRDAIMVPAEIEGQALHTGASIGIALFPRDGTDATTLLRSADAAMYQAKSAGGGSIHFFTQALNAHAARHLALRGELHGALERGEFELHYQPIFDCVDNTIVGAEALLRWRRAGTLVAPGDFLDVAEDSGLIVPIGAWALRTACARAQAWPVHGASAPYVSVNLSARQFVHGDLAGTVRTALAATGLAPHRLVLELTEGTMMRDLATAAAILGEIHALGVRVAIDDFGTGYSSLAYLKRLPVDKLKIDRCFVQDAPTDANDKGIVRAVIELAHALDMRVVAEGVENDAQIALLKKLGCDRMQGYRLGRPMPAEAFEEQLRA